MTGAAIRGRFFLECATRPLEHHPTEDVSDVEMLQHLIESKNASQRQVAGGAGISVSTLCEIMAGRRKMNRSHIEKLSAFFNVEPSVFLPRIRSKRKRTSASELLDQERGRR
jgi:transcriptional regulator with XRE-family HTH domain